MGLAEEFDDYAMLTGDIADAFANQMKSTYRRPRPVQQWGLDRSIFDIPEDGTVCLCEKDESQISEDCDSNQCVASYGHAYVSYQSGHSSRFFGMLLVTLEAVGDSMNKYGYTSRIERIEDYCHNRVVVRAHWLSDTVAGRYGAATSIGMLNGYKAYHVYRKRVLAGDKHLKENVTKDIINDTDILS